MAWQWLFATFVLIMLSAAHIFEIPFMVFNPSAFAKSNDTRLLCNITDEAQQPQEPLFNATSTITTTRAPVMVKLMKDDIPFANIAK